MASKKKFQHNEIVNHQDTGNQQKQSTSLTLSAILDSSKNLGRRTSVRQTIGRGRRGRVRGGQAGGDLDQNRRFRRYYFCVYGFPKRKSRGCNSVHHGKENHPNPIPTMVMAQTKKRAKQDQNGYSEHCQNSSEQGVLTHTQGSLDQSIRQESEVKAEFQPPHKLL